MERFIYGGEPKRISRILIEKFAFSYSYIQKLFRKSDIKIDGKRIKEDIFVQKNQGVVVYSAEKQFVHEVVFEDKNVVFYNKFRGISSENFACEIVKINPSYVLCHRLDTNTTGLLLFAKSQEIFEAVKEAFRTHAVEKHYLCEVFGLFPPQADFHDFLEKDAEKGVVKLFSRSAPGRKECLTKCVLIEKRGEISLVDVEPITGRTHQIRAHLAYRGYPVVGDGKYGNEQKNRVYKTHVQHLCAYRFGFRTASVPLLAYLDGKTVSLPLPIVF